MNRKMNRTLLAVMLAIVLLLSAVSLMAACGGGEDDEMAKTVVGGRDSDIGIQMSPAGPSTSEKAAPASPRVSASVSPETLLPRDTSSPPSMTASPPTLATASPPSVTATPYTPPVTATPYTPYVTVSPPDPVKTVRHHVTGGTECWCGDTHRNSASYDLKPTHKEYNCFCDSYFGNDYDYANTRHHAVNFGHLGHDEICWCGLVHYCGVMTPEADRVHTNSIDCWCWQMDSLADTATKVVRHHIVKWSWDDSIVCWCGVANHGAFDSHDGMAHADLDCWCLGYGNDYNEMHHIVNAGKYEDLTEFCWCGARHYSLGFEHTMNVNCPCWRYDTEGMYIQQPGTSDSQQVPPEDDTERP